MKTKKLLLASALALSTLCTFTAQAAVGDEIILDAYVHTPGFLPDPGNHPDCPQSKPWHDNTPYIHDENGYIQYDQVVPNVVGRRVYIASNWNQCKKSWIKFDLSKVTEVDPTKTYKVEFNWHMSSSAYIPANFAEFQSTYNNGLIDTVPYNHQAGVIHECPAPVY